MKRGSIEDFLHSAANQIRDPDHFDPWQYVVEVCISSPSSPLPEAPVSPLWKHNPMSPHRTIIISDSCLSAYDASDAEIVLIERQNRRAPQYTMTSCVCCVRSLR